VEREAEYIRQIIAGDASRFAWFVDAYKDMAFSIAARILGNDQDAEEVVQDSFLQAYRSIRTFKGNSKFSTWLYRIVVNSSLNRLPKKRAVYEDIELLAEQVPAIESTYRGLTSQDQTRYIDQAMEKLRPEDRLILTLYYLEEQSLGEIAEITGDPKENIKMRLHRARNRMYGVLSKLLNMKAKIL
jgi:RNA polymerase sigma-70 factor, ECF subfamily